MTLRDRLLATADRAPLALDGSYGEGGGQLLRTALALAVALGRPVTVTRIRAGRPNPGLQPQHLTVVRALATISRAEVTGDRLGSTDLRFVPRALIPGAYEFDVGAVRASAGSVSLLFQALFLPLALAPEPSRLRLRGGTHVPWSPPVHHLTEVFLPALGALGLDADVRLLRWGWYPAGGGLIEATVAPVAAVAPLVTDGPPPDGGPPAGPLAGGRTSGPPLGAATTREPAPASRPGPLTGLAAVSRLPRAIAERLRERALARLAQAGHSAEIGIETDETAQGPGAFLFLARRGRAGFSALGRRGLPAEAVADAAVDALLAWLRSGAAADPHLADQLVPVLALAAGPSAYTCPALTGHLRTVAWVVEQCLPVRVRLAEGPPARVEIVPRR